MSRSFRGINVGRVFEPGDKSWLPRALGQIPCGTLQNTLHPNFRTVTPSSPVLFSPFCWKAFYYLLLLSIGINPPKDTFIGLTHPFHFIYRLHFIRGVKRTLSDHSNAFYKMEL